MTPQPTSSSSPAPTPAAGAADAGPSAAAALEHPLPPAWVSLLSPVGGWSRLVASGSKTSPWRKLTAVAVQLSSSRAVRITQESADGRHFHETVAVERWPAWVRQSRWPTGVQLHVQATDRDHHARLTKQGRWLTTQGRVVQRAAEPLPARHDAAPVHPLPIHDPQVRDLMVAVGLVSQSGQVRGSHSDKYRQVQHFVELLRGLPVLAELPADRPLRIVDAGCGQAYMSLALWLFAMRQLAPSVAVSASQSPVELLGIDRNAALVEKVRQLAARLGYAGCRFVAGDLAATLAGSSIPGIDLLVSLHACDTATDLALALAIRGNARAVVVAPCCHHELSTQLTRATPATPGDSTAGGDLADRPSLGCVGFGADNAAEAGPGTAAVLDPMLRHGLFHSRFCDLLTDTLRALALEVFGYRADVLEFVSAEHTARNVMIRAQRRDDGGASTAASSADPLRRRRSQRAAAEFARICRVFGVDPAIRRLLDDRWPSSSANGHFPIGDATLDDGSPPIGDCSSAGPA